MTRRTITLILAITAIIAAIAFITSKKETGIEKVLLTDRLVADYESYESIKGLDEFESSSEISVIIVLDNIKTDDYINIRWKKIEGGQELLVQEDTIIEKQEGSGPLIISLAKKNNKHDAGIYKIYISLNEAEVLEKTFKVR